MAWRYTEHVLEASAAFRYLILSFIPVSLTYIFGTILTANGSLKQLNIMAVSGLILNFVLNYILIAKMGASGAAVATLLTQWITAIIQIVLAMQILKIKFDVGHILKLFLLVFLFTICASFIHLYSNNLLTFVTIILVTLLISALTGVLPIKKSISLLLNKTEDT